MTPIHQQLQLGKQWWSAQIKRRKTAQTYQLSKFEECLVKRNVHVIPNKPTYSIVKMKNVKCVVAYFVKPKCGSYH